MNAPWLTIHELAKALKVSIKTVRRAYLRGEIPVERIFRFVRFDLDRVREAIERNGHRPLQTVDRVEGRTRRAPGGASRRREAAPSPRIVKRGRKFQPRSRRSV